MLYDNLMELVTNRRSIRRFQTEPVPDDYIEKIIDVAMQAPSGFNMQPWEYFVVKDAKLRQKISGYMEDYWRQCAEMEQGREEWQGAKWKMEGLAHADHDYSIAPVYIILYGDPRVKKGLPMGVRGDAFRESLIFNASLANTFLYLHLAATSLGLAAQWISASQYPYANNMTKQLLNIPMDFQIFDMVALGWPSLEVRPRFMRDKQEMVHYDICKPEDFRTDEEVQDFINKARRWNVGTHSRKADKPE